MAAPSCLSWFSLLGAILAQKTNLWDWITCAIGHYFPAGSQTAVPQSFSCTSLSSPQVHSFTFAFCYPSNIIRIWCLCSPPQPCLGRLYILWGSWCLQIFFFWPSKNKICLEQGRGREGGECGPIMVRIMVSERWGQRWDSKDAEADRSQGTEQLKRASKFNRWKHESHGWEMGKQPFKWVRVCSAAAVGSMIISTKRQFLFDVLYLYTHSRGYIG